MAARRPRACTKHAPTPDAPAYGSGALDGQVNGQTIVIASALTGCGLIGGQPTRRVVLFNIPDACSTIATSWPNDELWLAIDLFELASDGTWSLLTMPGTPTIISDDPTGPGTYAVVTVQGAMNTDLIALSGNVTISTNSPGGTMGTFDVELDGTTHVSGWFDAPHCTTVPMGTVPNGDLFPCP